MESVGSCFKKSGSKQIKFLRHVARKEGDEMCSLAEKIEKTRSRERIRVMWMSSLKDWLNERWVAVKEVELMAKARSRKLWHNMTD